MALTDFLFGKNERLQQIPRYAPNQMGALNQILSQGLGNLNSLSSQSPLNLDFGPIAEQARSNFAQRTVPLLSERFTDLGGQGGQRSSAFPGQLSSAAANLERDLAGMQSQYGLQQGDLRLRERALQQNMLQSLLGLGLTPQFDTFHRPGNYGLLGQLLGSGAQAAGTLAPMMLSGYGGGFGGGGSHAGNLLNLMNLVQRPSGYNNQLGFGNQDFSGAFGRGLMF